MKETNMSTKYQPNAVEEGRYDQWVASGVFAPNEDKTAEPYSIVIPPPNVTGKLHLGHAWDVTLQDMYQSGCKVTILYGYQVWTMRVSQRKLRLKQN